MHPALLARARRLAARRWVRRGDPLVTIVVPVYNVAEYLPEFLRSVVDQTYVNLDILVIDDGSPDQSADIARAWARWDPRIRVITQPNGGLGAARNTGVREARGEFLTFADSDDTLARRGIELMVDSLARSGSDFVVGTMARKRGARSWLPEWTKKVHRRDRFGITVEDLPDVLLDVFACNKLWRAEYFREAVGGFPVGISYEDQEPSARSYLKARAFDVLRDTVYYWRVRDDGTSISQQKTRLQDLQDRLAVSTAVVELVAGHGSEVVRRAWASKIFGVDLIQYMNQVPRTDETYWVTLRDGVTEIVEALGDDAWRNVDLHARLCTWFTAQDDREGLVEMLSGQLVHGAGMELLPTGDALRARPSYLTRGGAEVPPWLLDVDPAKLTLATGVTGARWVSGSRVELSGFAYSRDAIAGEGPPALTISVVSIDGDARLEIPHRRIVDTTLNQHSRTEWVDASRSAFSCEVDVWELIAADPEVTAWRIEVEAVVAGTRLRETLIERIRDGAAAVLGFSDVPGDGDASRRFVLTHDGDDGLVFRFPQPRAVAVSQELRGRLLRVRVASSTGVPITGLHIRNAKTWQSREFRPVERGGTTFEAVIPALPGSYRPTDVCRWDVRVRFADGSRGRLSSAHGTHSMLTTSDQVRSLALVANAYGYLELTETPWRLTATAITIDAEAQVLSIEGDADIPGGGVPALELASGATRVMATRVHAEESGRFRADFELFREDWYGEKVALTRGSYALRATVPWKGASLETRIVVAPTLVPSLPVLGITDLVSVKATRTLRAHWLWIVISAPIPIEDRGYYMRGAALAEAASLPLREAIVFESYHGKQVSDSVRRLHDLVAEHYPHVERFWSTIDASLSVPAGTQRVIHGSREWIDAVSRARYLVNNANFPQYFRMREGQNYLQTWHGTPMKKIAEDMPPANLSLGYRLLMRREARWWQALLAQNDFASDALPRAFRYEGRTLTVGYPRNDILRSRKSERVAATVRARLGIPAGKRVVLYAPTFRDFSTQAGGYQLVADVEWPRLFEGMGEEAVVLLRGHANTVASDAAEADERVIDVSTYGEISELFLVADVLVTDYSSMMFDFCVTGKPILFFVPDLEEYQGSTRGFYLDFTDIRPGEMYFTTEALAIGVRDALRDPDAAVGDRYEAFVDRFAPLDDGEAGMRVLNAMVQEFNWFTEGR